MIDYLMNWIEWENFVCSLLDGKGRLKCGKMSEWAHKNTLHYNTNTHTQTHIHITYIHTYIYIYLFLYRIYIYTHIYIYNYYKTFDHSVILNEAFILSMVNGVYKYTFIHTHTHTHTQHPIESSEFWIITYQIITR